MKTIFPFYADSVIVCICQFTFLEAVEYCIRLNMLQLVKYITSFACDICTSQNVFDATAVFFEIVKFPSVYLVACCIHIDLSFFMVPEPLAYNFIFPVLGTEAPVEMRFLVSKCST